MENLEINDDTLELEGADEAEDLTKKLLDEQGKGLCHQVLFVIFLHRTLALKYGSFIFSVVFLMFLFYLLCMSASLVCIYICVCEPLVFLVPMEFRRGCQIPWNWS